MRWFMYSIFPTGMKMADICPVYKKLDSLCKDNYRSVNLLIVFSKLFERIMAEQLTIYFENILSTRVSAYRRGYSCQHAILNLTEYWRKALDDNQNVGTIGMDLSKAFDCMPHGLLLAKLFAYGVAPNAWLFISTYLKNRMHRVKIMGTSNDWATINRGVPQGSVLGPLLFNIFLNDLFYLPLNSGLVNHADDNHLCNSNKNLDVLQKELESDCARAVQWCAENQTTANSGKFQSILLSRHNIETFNINIGDHIISRSNTMKILGITLDEKLNFNEHIRNICQTSSRQINALRRISKFLNQRCREKVCKSFINANFGYCRLVWMLCGKCNLRRIEKLQERALRIVYQDSKLDYASLIGKSGQLSLRMNMIRILFIEIYKCVKGTKPDYLNEMFSLSNSRYDRDQYRLEQPKFNTKHSVIDPLNILEPNCGICSHLTWKVLMTCMYSKAIYTNGVSRKKRIRFLRRWIYSNNFSVWFDWISTYFVLFISFIASLFSTITISCSYHPHSFLVCGWVLMLW